MTSTGPVCALCGTWPAYCYCHTPDHQIREGYAHLVTLHTGHGWGCPACERLTDAGAAPDVTAQRRALRRIAEIHARCVPWDCSELAVLRDIQKVVRSRERG